MGLSEFLVWLSVGGGGAIAASWIWERIPWFQMLEVTVKQLVYFASCILLSIVAFLIQSYVPVETLGRLAPYFAIIASAFYSVFLGTTFHRASKSEALKSLGTEALSEPKVQ
jgi:hypothetical protein